MRRDWLNAAWQTDKGRQFESAEQAQMIMSLIMRMADDIAAALGVGEEFGPLMLGSTLESGEPVIVAQGWCWGFMAGMGSQFDAWEPHLDMLNELAGLRAKTLCRCVKFQGSYSLCRRRAEFASSGRTAAPGPRCLADLKERTGSAARRFCLVGLRHRVGRPYQRTCAYACRLCRGDIPRVRRCARRRLLERMRESGIVW
jgi:hypothetical protein